MTKKVIGINFIIVDKKKFVVMMIFHNNKLFNYEMVSLKNNINILVSISIIVFNHRKEFLFERHIFG